MLLHRFRDEEEGNVGYCVTDYGGEISHLFVDGNNPNWRNFQVFTAQTTVMNNVLDWRILFDVCGVFFDSTRDSFIGTSGEYLAGLQNNLMVVPEENLVLFANWIDENYGLGNISMSLAGNKWRISLSAPGGFDGTVRKHRTSSEAR